jgi:hypothetical protein
VLAYAAVSIAHGWLALPNAVLLKGVAPSASSIPALVNSLGLHAIELVSQNPALLVLMLLAFLTFFLPRLDSSHDRAGISFPAALFLYATLLHLQFAKTGWFYRYEGYLIALGMVTVFPGVVWMLRRVRRLAAPLRWTSVHSLLLSLLGFALLAHPLLYRARMANMEVVEAMYDRYLEHVQPARFAAKCYPNSTIAVNDIGAFAYFAPSRLLDLYGLASLEPIHYRRSQGDRKYTKQDVDEWTRREGAEIAILQIEWKEVRSRIPDRWVKVSEWEIPKNVVFGDSLVGFFAVEPRYARSLAQNMRQFAHELPGVIEVRFCLPETARVDCLDVPAARIDQ